jgi:hypothetical protein
MMAGVIRVVQAGGNTDGGGTDSGGGTDGGTD